MSREAMQMALEALEDANDVARMEFSDENYYSEAISALRQALVNADDTSQKRVDEKAKREHEPVCAHGVEKTECDFCQPEQEPVAWMYVNKDGECEQIEYGPVFDDPGVTPLYTAPPKRDLTCVCGAVWEGEMMVHPPRKREWVGLTDDEIDYQAKKDDHAVYFALGALWAEAKLKENNCGH